MRLIVTLLWLLAGMMWLPWALLALRLLLDLLLGVTPGLTHLGHAWAASPYSPPVVDLLILNYRLPHFDEHKHFIHGWFTARMGSMYAWAALAGCALTAAGWRLYWIGEEGLLRHGARAIAASVLVPPLASVLMYRDAQLRYRAAEAELAGARQDALRRLQG